ncbi:TadE/TadG family type IV pilus assembly protein [Desulfofundulus salinus]|uniref:TadE/TadG family type IV pilus assembly protein n=1 Tax=Desulfofundulus salinus TaxID=2419843 RepID=UPI0014023239|nr:hypothetical protein [Desulfofundulus salinum]
MEFAAASLVLVILFLGMMTLWGVLNDYANINKVCREGAREAALTGSEYAGYMKALEVAWVWGLKPERLSVEFYPDSGSNKRLVTCVVTYRAPLFSRNFPALAGKGSLDEVTLRSEATFGWWDFT